MVYEPGPDASAAAGCFGSIRLVVSVDGTLVPPRDHIVAAKSKNYRYSTNHQVVIDADTQLVVAVRTPLPGNRNDSVAFAASGVDHATRNATVFADGGYQGTERTFRIAAGRRTKPWLTGRRPQCLPPARPCPHRARLRVDEDRKILRDCRLHGDGSAEAMASIARLYNLTLTG
jgi:hypothetical protein